MRVFVSDGPGDTKISWAVLACLCFGTILRIHNFWLPHLGFDEYGTWWVVAGSTWTEVTERATRIQGQSPLYYLVVKLFTTTFGEGSFQLRLPSVIFGILTLVVAYRLAMQIFHDQNVALISIAVFSVTEQLIWYSQIARPYALALLLTLLSFLFFLQFLQSEEKRTGTIYAVTTALLIYSHYLFAFVLVTQIFVVMLRFGWREVFSKHWLLAFLLITVFCLPSIPQIVSLYGRRQTLDWIPHVPQTFQTTVLARGFADPWALLLAILTLLAVGIKPIDLRDPSTREVLLFLLAWLIIPLAGIWTVARMIGVSLFEARYILFVYPAAYYLLAWLMLHLKPANWLRWLPAGVFLMATLSISLIPELLRTGFFSRSSKLGWDQAARTLVAAGQPGDLVVFHSNFIEANLFAESPKDADLLSYIGWPLIVHLPKNHRFTLASLPFLRNQRTAGYIKSLEIKAAKSERLWVIGPDEERDYFREEMISQFGFQLVQGYSSENVKVTLLARSRRQS
jgi:4-amino-4-deoxy-L-arabinose transferase-like glycosyltransferase